jgi:hypothetical protein
VQAVPVNRIAALGPLRHGRQGAALKELTERVHP